MLVLTALILLIPIHGLILAAYPRGMWGDLSVTSMGVALLEWCAPKRARVLRHQLLWLLPLGLILMATTLGFGHPYYAWGYTSAFGITIAASALLCFWCQRESLAWVLLAASAGWQLQLLESRNAWDYVLDVPLLIWLIVILCVEASHVLRSGWGRGYRNE